MSEKPNHYKKFFLPFLIAVAAFALISFLVYQHRHQCPLCLQLKSFSPEVIRHYVLGFGPWALTVYIVLYAVNTVSLLPPIGIMSLAAGFIFGPWWGALGIMAGSFLGTTATFCITRFFSAKFIDRFSTGKAGEFQKKLNANGFKVILFIRLIPLLPWEVVNYAAGLSKIKYRDYISATLIGIFPSVIIQTYFSDRISSFNLKDPTLLIAIGAFVLLGAVPAIYLKNKKDASKL